jgi:hypothetical protein
MLAHAKVEGSDLERFIGKNDRNICFPENFLVKSTKLIKVLRFDAMNQDIFFWI